MAMSEYRLYFVDQKGAIQAREEFIAPDDDAAVMVSDWVCRACSDTCQSYELWQGDRRVIAFNDSRSGNVVAPTDRQTLEIQQITLAIEESLQRSHWLIARSERLIAETQRLKERVTATRIGE